MGPCSIGRILSDPFGGTMDGQWYYVHNGASAGPVSAESLLRLAADGTVQVTTYVWQEGMPAWRPAGVRRCPAASAATCPLQASFHCASRRSNGEIPSV